MRKKKIKNEKIKKRKLDDQWYTARVIQTCKATDRVFLRFDGYECDAWDEWVPCCPERLRHLPATSEDVKFVLENCPFLREVPFKLDKSVVADVSSLPAMRTMYYVAYNQDDIDLAASKVNLFFHHDVFFFTYLYPSFGFYLFTRNYYLIIFFFQN